MSTWTDTIQGVVIVLMLLENRRQWRAIDKVRAAARGEGDRPAEPCRHDGSNGTCAECRLAHLYGDGDR